MPRLLARTHQDASNQAQAFTLIGVIFGMGSFLGPLIGGCLSQPATKYPGTFGDSSLLHAYPYLLPCLATAFVIFSDLIFAFFSLGESRKEITDLAEAKRMLGLEQASTENLRGLLEAQYEPKSRQWSRDLQNAEKNAAMWRGKVEELETQISDARKSRDNLERVWGVPVVLWRNPTFTRIAVIYMLFGFVFMSFNEVIPIWARGTIEAGGVDFSTSEIGLAQSAAGLCTLFAVVIAYPLIGESTKKLLPVSPTRLVVSLFLRPPSLLVATWPPVTRCHCSHPLFSRDFIFTLCPWVAASWLQSGKWGW